MGASLNVMSMVFDEATRHLSVDDKHRKWLCIIPEFMRPEGEHKRWNEHLPNYYATLTLEITSFNTCYETILYTVFMHLQ